MLVDAEVDLGHHRPPGIKLGLDGAHVGTEPAGEGHPTAGVAGDGVPDELVIVRVAAVRREPGVEGTRVGVHAVITKHHGHGGDPTAPRAPGPACPRANWGARPAPLLFPPHGEWPSHLRLTPPPLSH